MSLSANKQKVIDFFNTLVEYPVDIKKASSFTSNPFTSSHVVHPTYSGSPEEWATMFATRFPNKDGTIRFEVQRMIEEGDQVWVWVIIDGVGPRKHSVDLLTFKDGLIAEHFDVQQAIPVPEAEVK